MCEDGVDLSPPRVLEAFCPVPLRAPLTPLTPPAIQTTRTPHMTLLTGMLDYLRRMTPSLYFRGLRFYYKGDTSG